MARLGLVYSVDDPAGAGAAAALRGILGGEGCDAPGAVECARLPGGHVLAGFPGDTTGYEWLAERLPGVDAYIVLSRHASTSGRPTLSLHYPGNPGPEAALGGRPRELAYTWPRLFTRLAQLYHREAAERGLLDEYSFSLEATHHGPTGVPRPVMFIEIGSTPERWRDQRAHEAMAAAVAELLRAPNGHRGLACRTAIGIGGTHYPEKHTRLLLEGRYCYGHIFAKYTFQSLDEEILGQALDKSVEPIEGIVVLKVPSRVRQLAQRVAEARGLELWRP